jgi:hypothetical protein
MGAYKRYNGKDGFNAVHHTATGYRCVAKVYCPEDMDKKIEFYAKHVVGTDGRPYVEIGFDCKDKFNKIDLMDRVKQALIKFGFQEVFSINNCKKSDLAFCEYANPVPHTIELRINCERDGLARTFSALKDFISQDCIDFVQDQESNLEENLFASIMDSMGKDLAKGPGGYEGAKKRARDMADMFINGISLN